jgi:hypothetical protein
MQGARRAHINPSQSVGPYFTTNVTGTLTGAIAEFELVAVTVML